MASLNDRVVAFLNKREWPYDQRGSYIATPVVHAGAQWVAYLTTLEEAHQLIVHSMVPDTVPEHRRPAVALFLTRANYGLPIGNFEMDLDSGEVRYKTSVDVEGDELSDALIDHLLMANVVTTGRYLDGLRAVIGGAAPDLAAKEAETP